MALAWESVAYMRAVPRNALRENWYSRTVKANAPSALLAQVSRSPVAAAR